MFGFLQFETFPLGWQVSLIHKHLIGRFGALHVSVCPVSTIRTRFVLLRLFEIQLNHSVQRSGEQTKQTRYEYVVLLGLTCKLYSDKIGNKY